MKALVTRIFRPYVTSTDLGPDILIGYIF